VCDDHACGSLTCFRRTFISQFWPDALPTKQRFRLRNTVVSGYAAITAVVEAP
jgi:predicted Rossmann fold nucleotide-binding protein DprA/Smf involved in DNA uptake